MKDALSFIRLHWATIAALVAAVASVLAPGSEPIVAKAPTVLAAVLGASGMAGMAARSAARAEVRQMGLSSPWDD